MAACLITISGTSGEVRLDYKVATVPKHIIAGIGTFYLDDTVTSVTYTTLLGDAIASSLCLTITNLPNTCFKMFWKGLPNLNYKIDALIFNNTEIIPLELVNFPYSNTEIIGAVNSVNDTRFKITKYLISNADSKYSNDNSNISFSYILQTQGTIVPQLRVKNADNTGFIYIHGVVSTCSPVGYIEVNTCEPVIPL